MCLRLDRDKLSILKANYERSLVVAGITRCDCGSRVGRCKGCIKILEVYKNSPGQRLVKSDLVPF